MVGPCRCQPHDGQVPARLAAPPATGGRGGRLAGAGRSRYPRPDRSKSFMAAILTILAFVGVIVALNVFEFGRMD